MKRIINVLLSASCLVAIAFSITAFCKAEAAPAVVGQPVDLTYAAEKALPSVVHIKYVQNSKIRTVDVQSDPFSDFFADPFGGFFGRGNGGTQKRQIQTPKKVATGSGVIISVDGYIVTNNHVVDGADELIVTLNDNSEYSARIIGTDKTTDLALIKIDGKNLPAITIINSDDIKVGEWVLAVGNPLGLNNTVTAGIVSAKARSLGANGVESFIQTDAAINSGNSGGALVNTRGELVGINAMLYSQTGSYSGYGFAIPTTIMNKVVDDLKKYGVVQRAMLGVTGGNVKDYVDAQKENGKEVDLGTMEGVYIDKVAEDCAAADAGLEKGDVIISADGQKVTRMAELQEIIAKKRPGDKINLTYLRNKKKHNVSVTLKNEQGNVSVVKNADLDVLGAVFREVTDAQKSQLNIKYGVEVVKVNNGKLKDAGMGKGYIITHVNDTSIKTLDDLAEIVKSASTSKDPVLYIKGIYPTGRKTYYAVPLSE
ncbi:MAG: Do family serine endopeptidase [Prevotella sp.]|nr:Do family serine endopeptidase [Prevotella sp.]MDD7096673.1 Do family serine endopeptidase [Prevotellaceae bacterium]MCI7046462.1 Do family serine endopeptidase [Prevotella sp.]MDY5006290.1 Do family serine endopeptidase [Prevotella sp.]MDY5126293.1 Do family serine endopeptidase [Prevotella sp.]